MPTNITTKRDIVKPLQYVEEGTTAATFGVIPSSPTFTAAGVNVEINTDPRTAYERINALGTEDIVNSVKTGEAYGFTLKSNIFNSTFAKYGISAVGGTGTIGASLTFVFSRNIDGTEYFTKMVGCRPMSTTLSVARGPWELDMTWLAQEIQDETTTGITGATFVTAPPTTAPWTHSDSGANPLTWNSVAYPERRFSTTITRDLALLEVNGQVLIQFSKAANRAISFSADVYKKDTTLLTDYYDHTSRSASYVVKSATSTITYTNARLTDVNERHAGSDFTGEIIAITGLSENVSIT